MATPSRFLKEISSLEEISPLQVSSSQGFSGPGGSRPVPAAPGQAVDKPVLPLGDEVVHAKWGAGRCCPLREMDGDTVVTVAFPGNNLKQIPLSLAPLEKVEEGADFSS